MTTLVAPMTDPAASQSSDDLSFIETQFPVSKMSIESFRERTAKQGQTLTGLGKWWGRKPLVLCRAAILGLLLPATDNPALDRDVFLRLMTMDDDGLVRRRTKSMSAKDLFAKLSPADRDNYFEPHATCGNAKLKRGLSREEKDEIQLRVFASLSYGERMDYCCRPEQAEGPSKESWKIINEQLETSAKSLAELIGQLGKRKFGRVPRIGDSFCGGGSIPFEAARLGCDTYASDLNPVAGLLTWAALNIVGGGEAIAQKVQQNQKKVFDAVDRQIAEWGIEYNAEGWRADAFLYCVETVDPESGWVIPLAPSWIIGEKSRAVAKLVPDKHGRRFNIEIVTGVSDAEMEEASASGTVSAYRLVPPGGKTSTPIESLSRNLRVWEQDDIVAREGDVFQDRLFCVRWVETYFTQEIGEESVELSESHARALPDFDTRLESGMLKQRTRRHYRAVTDHDRKNEQKVLELLRGRMPEWRKQGIIPSRAVERGKDINRPTNARGWSYWHHFFNPRQLLMNGLFAEQLIKDTTPEADQIGRVGSLLGLGRIVDWNSKQSRWHPNGANEKGEQTFYKPSLSTPLFNYCCRALSALDTTFLASVSASSPATTHSLRLGDARICDTVCDFWITDPPYADAVNYHELSEYFLAWYEKLLPKIFPHWYADSKRALAIKADKQEVFRESMVECYKRLATCMPPNGMQVVMFTHQDAGVWADLTTILWAAGLQVTAAWCIATETEAGGVKLGNYVQGTVLLILRKQKSEQTAFLDEVYNEVENEVRRQLDNMLALDDAHEPNFTDTDYQLAAYAAALRVLTSKKIEEIDVAYELTRARAKGEKSQIEDIIEKAVKIACDHLVPKGIDTYLWKSLSSMEKFCLKGLEMESHGEYRDGVYQELARGFGVGEYRAVLASTKANQTRVRTASEFGRREMGGRDTGDSFGHSIVRHALFAAFKAVDTDGTKDSLTWLKTEVPDYAASRGRLIEILDFLATFEQNASMPHWHKDSHAAGLVAGAMRNREDHV